MTTPAQAAANARNARLSTGPRTARGKRRSALNSLRDGVYATTFDVISAELLEECFDDIQELLDGIVFELQPEGVMQTASARFLAHRMLNVFRADRLTAPMIDGAKLTAAESAAIGPSRREYNYAETVLCSLATIELDIDANHTVAVIELHARQPQPAKVQLLGTYSDGLRLPQSNAEWRDKLDQLITTQFGTTAACKEAMQKLRVQHMGKAERETQLENSIMAKRIVKHFSEATDLHDRVSRQLSQAIRQFKQICELTVDLPRLSPHQALITKRHNPH